MLHRLIGIALLLLSFAGAWSWMTYQKFIEMPLPVPAEGMTYQVTPGSSMARVAQELRAHGVLAQPRWFRWYARWQGLAHKIQAGEYRLEAGLTVPALLELLTSGRTISHSLTLVEGWNFRQVRAAIASHEAIATTLQGVDDAEVMERLGYAGVHPEGRFFPDTYLFPRGTTDVEFLQRAYRRMQHELAALWETRAPDLPLADPDQALTLASIVEKETAVPDERAQIAGVFVRRLRKGMKLQTDPTVIYGMGEHFDGNIRRADLLADTPYNTYVRAGLPPTPICMPGREAIAASLQPDDQGYVYFVARGDGSHAFSKTLQAHNAAVRRYQLGGRD